MSYQDRDLSWLQFNARILQEVENKDVPLMERLKFIAIYSSNLEEFYKVRVATHRFEQRYKGDKKNKYGYRPSFILHQINLIVSEQQEKLGHIFRNEILPEMEMNGIQMLDNFLTNENKVLVENYFDEQISGHFELLSIDSDHIEMKNQAVYLFIISGNHYYLLEMDYKRFGRFIEIHHSPGERRIIQLDDIFRINMHKIIETQSEVFAVKVSRDAELYIDEEQDTDLVKRIQKSLKKRDTGLPSRLLFDENIPFKYINKLRKQLDLDIPSLMPGGRYHNFYDYFGFPDIDEMPDWYYKTNPKVKCAVLEKSSDWFETITKRNVFLSYPYQSFNYVSDFLHKAAADEKVEEINVTIYRVNRDSEICKALETALKNGKKVFVLDEVLARFDEESNIYWGERLSKAGAVVKYGVDNLKVHAKIYTIKRKEEGKLKTYAYLGTGNLNEKTANIYADHGILTASPDYTSDLDQIFEHLKNGNSKVEFKHLLVAPFTLRKTISKYIQREIKHAQDGKEAKLMFKMNSLEDLKMIDQIRGAAEKGVKVDLMVRGICCYKPTSKKQSENIRVVSIIDQYLEHTRIYHFHNNGKPDTYLASADLMNRNLSSRIEVAFPVFEEPIRDLLLDQMNAQLADGKKGRYLTGDVENKYVRSNNTDSSQMQMFDLVEKFESS